MNLPVVDANDEGMPLTDLAYELECTKGQNGYCLIYEPFFRPLKHHPNLNILEIGLCQGGPELDGNIDRRVSSAPSLNLWLNYFPHAHVTGFDISDFGSFANDRFTFVRGDSGNRADLEKVKSTGRMFDIIIDDGSHASFHQQLMLAKFLPLLKPGGLYIIEDLNWQPTQYEASLPRVIKTQHFLSRFLRNGKIESSPAIDQADAGFLEANVAGVFLFDNGYIDANKRRYVKENGLAYVPPSDGARWRVKSGCARLLDPYFWRFVTRGWTYARQGEEFTHRDYIQLAILQRR